MLSTPNIQSQLGDPLPQLWRPRDCVSYEFAAVVLGTWSGCIYVARLHMTSILATFAHHAYFGSAEYLGCDSEILGYRGQGPARVIGARCHRPRPFRD